MAYYIRKKKQTNECDCDCAAPMNPIPDGMGPVIPGVSGDRMDNILGAGFVSTVPMMPAYTKKFKVKRRKK